ncbi:MAG: hypothetical protein CMF41_02535 [Legionellales bacterium]|nr:hypothetical protein [Legionellales bacterium]OUX65719.1 MAG: hypothetical protein CBE41_01295 [Gammaproteobacteria bacterium TMED281]|tara:strand:- start:21 stop:425 length:405 start_codon:yes stop_codon:yes gene_type:complete
MTTVPPKINRITNSLNKKFGIKNNQFNHKKIGDILPEKAKNQFKLIERENAVTLIIETSWLTWARLNKKRLENTLPVGTKLSIQPLIPYESLQRVEKKTFSPSLNQTAKACLQSAAKQCSHPKLRSVLDKLSKY